MSRKVNIIKEKPHVKARKCFKRYLRIHERIYKRIFYAIRTAHKVLKYGKSLSTNLITIIYLEKMQSFYKRGKERAYSICRSIRNI